ncbi:MAG: glycosyltransferase family 2 protein [Chloroflexales bacterium]|nr:glycosyltransferase family 2 protein [Chloroflexales bacterium]
METAYVAMNIRHCYGPRRVRIAADQLVVVSLVRDGERYMHAFIEYYLALGASQIVLLDNGSLDQTIEIARRYPHVTILSSKLNYGQYQRQLKSYLIRRFGQRCWSLCVDIDELFDYPGSRQIDLSTFLRYLRAYGYNAVVAQMLDMFAQGPILDRGKPTHEDLRVAYPLADVSNTDWREYHSAFDVQNQLASVTIQACFGGIRKTIFDVNVLLTKHPLLFLEGGMRPMDPTPHAVNRATVADLTCVLYHYKFTGGFADLVQRAVLEENYFRRSAEYKRYQEVLDHNPLLGIETPTAWPVEHTDELVERRFLVVSAAYNNWIETQRQRSRPAPT